MLPATNRGVGMNIGFPDVCLTPVGPAVVPIPYPNFALTAQAAVFSPIVRVSGVHALNMASMIPMTFGDDAGVAHWSFKGPGRYIMGNPLVYVDRLPAINLTCPTMGNTGNNPIGAVLVPSAVNVFYTYNHCASDAVTPDAAVALGDDILGRSKRTPLSWSMLNAHTGLLRVELITTDMARQFHVAFMDLVQRGARALVLDMRECPGGDLDGAVEWAACFLHDGAEIVYIEDAEGDEIIRRASLPAVYEQPLAILVNEKTASAAEVFVSSLQAHARARILGHPTYGKATVQRLVPGQTNTYDYPTVARCYGPERTCLAGGVFPDTTIDKAATDCDWHNAALVALGS